MVETHLQTSRRAGGAFWFFLPIAAVLALVIMLYRGTFVWWWWEWTFPGSYYAHALFVPFFVVAMIWRDRLKLAAAPWDPSWLGLLYIVPAILLLVISAKSDVTTIQSISFMLLVLGLSTMLIGKTRTRIVLFPLLFIMMMMPLLPDQLINIIAFPVQVTSAKIATFLLNAMTLHATRVGTLIVMDSYRLAVEVPCSGFKTLVSLLTFAAAFAYLIKAPAYKRWILFLTTVPLSLIINSLRITLIGIVGELISTKAAATFHDYSGFIVLIIAFTFLFNFAKMLGCESFMGWPLEDESAADKAKEHKAGEGKEPAPVVETPEEPAFSIALWWKEVSGWRPTEKQFQKFLPFAVAANLVLLSIFAVQAYALRPIKNEAPISRAQVPDIFESNGVTYTTIPGKLNDKLTHSIQELLNPTRIINRIYRGSDGSKLELFITAGNGRKVFHDPHNCMLGSDALLSDIGQISIPSAAGPVRVLETRFRTATSPAETEMMMCYIVEGNQVPRTEDVRNRIILQTLLGDGGKPSYSFRLTQTEPGTDESKRRPMINFISGLWKHIGPVLTGKEKGDPSDPPPVAVDDAAAAQ